MSRRRNLPSPRVGIMIRSVFSHVATHSMTAAGSPSSILSVCRMPEKWALANSFSRCSCWARNSWRAGENKITPSLEPQGVSGAGPEMYSGARLTACSTVTVALNRSAISLTKGAMEAPAAENAMGKRILRTCIIGCVPLTYWIRPILGEYDRCYGKITLQCRLHQLGSEVRQAPDLYVNAFLTPSSCNTSDEDDAFGKQPT